MDSDNHSGFYEQLSHSHLKALWDIGPSLQTPTPREPGRPFVWRWSTVYPLLQQATQEVRLERGAERRVLILAHPDYAGGTTPTMTGSLQMILPGEVAPSHRHTPTAIRFIIQGDGAYTDVEGERIPMHVGDLVLTPSWTWHDHGNLSTGPVVWFDGLDAPLVRALKADFFEPDILLEHPLTHEPGYSLRRVGLVRPTGRDAREKALPLIYCWQDAYRELQNPSNGPGDPFDGVTVQYINPLTNGPALPTMDCQLHRLVPGQSTQSHRHTGHTLYFVVRGEGATTINQEPNVWSRGDFVYLPAWAAHHHTNMGLEDCILFSMSDRPVLEALGLYREEPAVR